MMRILTLTAGLAGAAGLSQFPEFSQQYLQRLGGAVDELQRVVADFDASAEGVGMTRDQALSALSEGAFQEARQADMRRTIAREARLSADLAALRDASMAQRALQPQRFTDPEIAAAAWADFKPAVPVTLTGAGFAGTGFIVGGGVFAALLRLLGWPLRRLRGRGKTPRAEPQVPPRRRTPSVTAADHGPRPALPIGWLARTNGQPHKVVQAGQALQVSVLSVEPGDVMSGQGGKATDTVLVCLEGRGEVTHDGETRSLSAGELVSLPPGVAHQVRNLGEAPLRLFSVEPKTARAPRAEPKPAPALKRAT